MSYRHTAKSDTERQIAFFEALHKEDLHQLADRLLLDEAEAIELCVTFIEADTPGNWHGRARDDGTTAQTLHAESTAMRAADQGDSGATRERKLRGAVQRSDPA